MKVYLGCRFAEDIAGQNPFLWGGWGGQDKFENFFYVIKQFITFMCKPCQEFTFVCLSGISISSKTKTAEFDQYNVLCLLNHFRKQKIQLLFAFRHLLSFFIYIISLLLILLCWIRNKEIICHGGSSFLLQKLLD